MEGRPLRRRGGSDPVGVRRRNVFRRGVQFLLKTQLADGSWFVTSRALPIQPHFESGFPHGRDQFVSAAATNWAALALAMTSSPGPARKGMGALGPAQ